LPPWRQAGADELAADLRRLPKLKPFAAARVHDAAPTAMKDLYF